MGDSVVTAAHQGRSSALAAAICSVVGITLLAGRAWPWAVACLVLELLGFGLAVRYVDRHPGDRRWFGAGVVALTSVVLAVTVVLLVFAIISWSLSSLAPP